MGLVVTKNKKKASTAQTIAKPVEKEINRIENLPIQIPVNPQPQEIKPEFIEVPTYKNFTEQSIYTDVLSHLRRQPFVDENRSTMVHENAHMIHSELRKQYNSSSQERLNAFYLLNGKAALVEEPKIKKNQINSFVPINLQSYRFRVYFVTNQDWDYAPLYVMDEWSAYILGAKCYLEDYKNGRYNKKWTDGVSGCLDFSIYTIALCMAIEKHDPTYWQNNKQFKSFVSWQLKEACSAFMEGRSIDAFKWDKQDLLLQQLLESEEAKPYREMLKKEFESTWLDVPTKVFFKEETYENYQKVILSLDCP